MRETATKESLGQHFLRDAQAIRTIAGVIPIGAEVLEIGPGLGARTERLLEQGAVMTVVEVDRELAARLAERGEPRLTVHQGDALRLDWPALLAGFLIAGGGIGMTTPALATAAIGVVEPRRSGMASGINSTFRQVGVATGIAAWGAIFQDREAARYRRVVRAAAEITRLLDGLVS